VNDPIARANTPIDEDIAMPWSWKLVRIAGIDVYVHATFFMVIAWIALIHWNESQNLAAVIDGVGFILALFACVVLHEFGHALTAARFGIRTRDITLLPIGGLARLERMPDVPLQELWVALAGPAVNVVIAIVLFAWLRGSGAWEAVEGIGVTAGTFGERVMVANVFLAGFNLLPAFPMDGGRALRAVLATRMEYTRATQWAAMVGQCRQTERVSGAVREVEPVSSELARGLRIFQPHDTGADKAVELFRVGSLLREHVSRAGEALKRRRGGHYPFQSPRASGLRSRA
jgi:Zn-dependent protease